MTTQTTNRTGQEPTSKKPTRLDNAQIKAQHLVGRIVNIRGSKYRINRVTNSFTGKHYFYLTRVFDGSAWFAITNHLNRFTEVGRVFDVEHENLDKNNPIGNVKSLFNRM